MRQRPILMRKPLAARRPTRARAMLYPASPRCGSASPPRATATPSCAVPSPPRASAPQSCVVPGTPRASAHRSCVVPCPPPASAHQPRYEKGALPSAALRLSLSVSRRGQAGWGVGDRRGTRGALQRWCTYRCSRRPPHRQSITHCVAGKRWLWHAPGLRFLELERSGTG